MTEVINKSDLIQDVSARCDYIPDADVDEAVREIIDLLSEKLIENNRIEVRGFGTFACTTVMPVRAAILRQERRLWCHKNLFLISNQARRYEKVLMINGCKRNEFNAIL